MYATVRDIQFVQCCMSSRYVMSNIYLFKLFVKYEEFEDTKGTIRIHKLKKYRQHNDQMKKY